VGAGDQKPSGQQAWKWENSCSPTHSQKTRMSGAPRSRTLRSTQRQSWSYPWKLPWKIGNHASARRCTLESHSNNLSVGSDVWSNGGWPDRLGKQDCSVLQESLRIQPLSQVDLSTPRLGGNLLLVRNDDKGCWYGHDRDGRPAFVHNDSRPLGGPDLIRGSGVAIRVKGGLTHLLSDSRPEAAPLLRFFTSGNPGTGKSGDRRDVPIFP